MITSEAITLICIIILTLLGILLRNKDITTFDIERTATTAIVITTAVSIFVVIARAEHIPRT